MNSPGEWTAPIVLFNAQDDHDYGPLFGTLDELLGYVEAVDVWNHEFTVFDATGKEVVLVAESDIGPVSASISPSTPRPEEVRLRLAESVRQVGAVRYGLIDADVDLPALLRALWKREHPKRPYPG